MGKQNEIIISGVGGQGLILCGTLMAQAAVLHDHRQATLSSEYGVETRGTFAKSDVIISDQEIYFPDVTEPDIIVCLAQTAYERYAGKYGPEVLIIYNQDEVAADPAYSASQQGIDITKISRELGNTAVANIVTLGIVAGRNRSSEGGDSRRSLERNQGILRQPRGKDSCVKHQGI